ncbi:MAG: ATP-binding cassette domain-containing protein [Sulfurospirillaceae bacterium]|nr:ATP-binding cassette domain-containing protein [Sulfurospirillaceae bacterium]MDD2826408.1 ATP-binding cassette domain-containing protein [Sulfurospirillaceae bacterium]
MIEIAIEKELLGSHGKMPLHVTLSIEDKSFVALSGQSGSGKTTLLRILAGLENARGTIRVDGEEWLNEKYMLAPQQRGIGFVFQDYALFPNMSVIENLLFVRQDKALAQHLLKLIEMDELAQRKPNTLSGGQKQRVSLCRAMMNHPKLLLMDEPLSALDPLMRTKLQHEILTLHKEFETTTIMVSHDPSEIYRLSNRVIVLNQGNVIQDGDAKSVLLKTQGSQKFSFEGELLDIIKVDVIYVAIVSIGQQIVEVVLDESEARELHVGSVVNISTKAFAPVIQTSKR